MSWVWISPEQLFFLFFLWKKRCSGYLRATIIYAYKFYRILKIVDLAGINFSDFAQLLVLLIQKSVMNLILAGTIFSKNGAVC